MLARALLAHSAGPRTLGRPFVAVSRRRPPVRAYWTFRLEFTTGDEELLWETLIGISCAADPELRVRAADVRRAANLSRDVLTHIVGTEHERLAARLLVTLREPVTLARLREQAIVTAAQHRHARLAAALIQRGLFDRRTERDAAAQTAALDDTLSRCRVRLAQLARRQHPLAGDREPAFALIRV